MPRKNQLAKHVKIPDDFKDGLHPDVIMTRPVRRRPDKDPYNGRTEKPKSEYEIVDITSIPSDHLNRRVRYDDVSDLEEKIRDWFFSKNGPNTSCRYMLVNDDIYLKASLAKKFIRRHNEHNLALYEQGMNFDQTIMTVNGQYVWANIFYYELMTDEGNAGNGIYNTIKDSDVLFYVFDVNKPSTFDKIKDYYIRHNNENENTVRILVGIETGLNNTERQVSYDVAKKYADNKDIEYVEINLTNSTNIADLFINAAAQKLEKDKNKKPDLENETYMQSSNQNTTTRNTNSNKQKAPVGRNTTFAPPPQLLQENEGSNCPPPPYNPDYKENKPLLDKNSTCRCTLV